MKFIKKAAVILSVMLVFFSMTAGTYNVCAYAKEDSVRQSNTFIVLASDSPVSGTVTENSKKNIVGIVGWVIAGIGVLYVIYLLFSMPRKKKGLTLKGVKYRRSPYKKTKRRIVENDYYNYKKQKYK